MVPWLPSVPASVPPVTVIKPVPALVSVPASVPPEKTSRPEGKLNVAELLLKVPPANWTRPVPEPV